MTQQEQLQRLRDRFNSGKGSFRERQRWLLRIEALREELGEAKRPEPDDPFDGLVE